MNNENNIMNEIEKRLKTTMIGSLAQFEKYFGYLWENDHANREKYEDLWETTRNNILNNGNHQTRLALKILADYLYGDSVKQKYHYKFYFNKEQNDKNQY